MRTTTSTRPRNSTAPAPSKRASEKESRPPIYSISTPLTRPYKNFVKQYNDEEIAKLHFQSYEKIWNELLNRLRITREAIIDQIESSNKIKAGTFLTPVDKLISKDEKAKLDRKGETLHDNGVEKYIAELKAKNEQVYSYVAQTVDREKAGARR